MSRKTQQPDKNGGVIGVLEKAKFEAIVQFAYSAIATGNFLASAAQDFAENVDVLSEDETGSSAAFIAPHVAEWNDLVATLPALNNLEPLAPQVFTEWLERHDRRRSKKVFSRQ